jgi:predicted MPP superfamily phosphohydrolase
MKEDWKERIHEVIQILAPLKNSRSSIFAVLGNHDYAMERPGVLSSPWLAHRLEIQLEKIGIQVLTNESHKFRNENNDILYIVGVGPHYPRQDEPIAALESVPDDAPRIVFMHNPLSFKKIPSHAAPIAIAAHTHGGQIRIPFLPDWSWLNIVEDQEIDVDGWINDYGSSGNHLYINRGIGFSIFPIRINCPPELTIFTLS